MEDETVGANSTHGWDGEYTQNFNRKTWRQEISLVAGADGKIILTRILPKYDTRMWAGLIWLKEGSCKEGNEPYSSLEVREFFRLWRDHKLPQNGPAGLELLQLQRVCCAAANNLRFSLSSTTNFIVSISRKMPKIHYFSTVWVAGSFANKL